MTERKAHPDNAMIDELEKDGAPSQSGSSGGSINRDVGSRSEMKNTTGPTETERPTAQDHPEAMNEAKGEKTIARLQPGNEG
jgi:hypothetical protein